VGRRINDESRRTNGIDTGRTLISVGPGVKEEILRAGVDLHARRRRLALDNRTSKRPLQKTLLYLRSGWGARPLNCHLESKKVEKMKERSD